MWAKQQIHLILDECNTRQGWTIPEHIVTYEAEILAKKIDKTSWQPEPSYAERYLTISKPSELVELAEVCWFTRAVFPELGTRRGINPSYYVDLGQGCYDRALQYFEDRTLRAMSQHFEFLAETVYTAIRLNQEFREMWEL